MKKLKVILDKINEHIIIVPSPDRDIKNGLRIKYNKDTKWLTDEGYCDIIKGKYIYDLPEYDFDNFRKVVKVWIQGAVDEQKL